MVFRLTLLNVLNTDFVEIPFTGNEENNRRVYERIQVDKNFKGFHGQDIFLVRDVSVNGMLVETSARSHALLENNKVYRCQLRYLDDKFTVHLGVRWKKDSFIGFQFVNPEPVFKKFIEDLVTTAGIGQSLKKIPKKLKDSQNKEVIWYSGLSDSHFFLWREDPVKKWFLIHHHEGLFLKNGNLYTKSLNNSLNLTTPMEQIEMLVADNDKKTDVSIKKKLLDILMASAIEEKDAVLDSF